MAEGDSVSGYVLRLEDIDGSMAPRVGNKASCLGEMLGAGLPVPQGFALTTDAFSNFLESNGIKSKIVDMLSKVDASDDQESLKSASNTISQLILNARVPDTLKSELRDAYDEMSVGKDIKNVGGPALDMIKAGRGQAFVTVRTSAASEDLYSENFLGQLGSVLAIQGREQLYSAIKRCWASMFMPWVIFYLKNRGVEGFPGAGLVIQKMVDADKSGIMFTANPANGRAEQMMIEAAWGYGDALVSGIVIPDEYVMSKDTGEQISKRIGKKKWVRRINQVSGSVVKENLDRTMVLSEVLVEPELKRLWEFGRKLEEHYGKPQNIEWAIEKGRTYIVQSRPMMPSGFSPDQETEAGPPPEGKMLLEGIAASPGIITGTAKVVRGHEDSKDIAEGEILFTRMTFPEDFPMLSKAAAIVTDDGGRVSHAAITARELKKPCIVGTDMGTTAIATGQKVVVDAFRGKVHEVVGPVQEPEQGHVADVPVELPQMPEQPSPEPAKERHEQMPSMIIGSERITATEIKASILYPGNMENHSATEKADGVGMMKAEHMLTESGKHPLALARSNPEELIATVSRGLGRVAKAFYPKAVWYRTLDARTDDFRELEGVEDEPHEENPMLGWHGIRRSIDEQDVFKCELRAVKRLMDSGLDNIAIMLPFVTRPSEVRHAKQIMAGMGLNARIGIMVETPAAALEIEQFCNEGISFVSIGSDSLAQLVLGVDRCNNKTSSMYSETDPAVMDLIKYVIRACKNSGVETSVCGEAGSNPKMVEMLVDLGIDSISTEPDMLEEVRRIVAKTERRILLQKLRNR